MENSATIEPPKAKPLDLLTYAQAALPDPYRILGLRLRPFSLGHFLLLQRFQCGFLSDDESIAERGDLLLGVLICSMTYDEFLTFIEQKDFSKELAKWGKSVGLFDFPEKAKLFRAYLKASLTEPNYISMQPADGDHGDWAQSLKMTLMTRLDYTEPEALSMPLSKALADYYRLAESEGLLRIITPEDEAAAEANAKIFEQLDAMRAKAEKEATWQV